MFVAQMLINGSAEMTEDRQRIQIDSERAAPLATTDIEIALVGLGKPSTRGVQVLDKPKELRK